MAYSEILKFHAVLLPFIWLNDSSQKKSASSMVQNVIEKCQEVRNSWRYLLYIYSLILFPYKRLFFLHRYKLFIFNLRYNNIYESVDTKLILKIRF